MLCVIWIQGLASRETFSVCLRLERKHLSRGRQQSAICALFAQTDAVEVLLINHNVWCSLTLCVSSLSSNLDLFRFATVQETGLLLYNGRYNERHDFIALEVVEGGKGVQFSFSLGSHVTRVVARLSQGVNDGQWHTVSVDYFNKVSLCVLWKRVLMFHVETDWSLFNY